MKANGYGIFVAKGVVFVFCQMATELGKCFRVCRKAALAKAERRIKHAPPIMPLCGSDTDLQSGVNPGGKSDAAVGLGGEFARGNGYGHRGITAVLQQLILCGGENAFPVVFGNGFGFLCGLAGTKQIAVILQDTVPNLQLQKLVAGNVAVGDYMEPQNIACNMMMGNSSENQNADNPDGKEK